MSVEQQLEARILLHLLAGDTLVEGEHLHLAGVLVEAHDGEVGDDAPHAALRQAALGARSLALHPAGRGDEVDVGHEAALLVLHGHDHVGERGDVVTAAGAGEAYPGVVGIADEGRVEVAEAVDLGAAHEAHVDIAALKQQEHVGDRQDHVGAARAALLVGRGRKLPRHDERPDHAALEQDRQRRRVQALRERRREQRDADPREHRLPVLEQARGHDREQLRCGVAGVLSH
jgi:hypothetical protein